MVDFVLNVKARNEVGKGASRRLRRIAKEVPAIVYGGSNPPRNISLEQDQLNHALANEAFYSRILTLKTDDKSEEVILKDVQRHPAQPIILHVDFLRVSKTQKLTTRVPLHFLNEDTCIGIKVEGGIIAHTMTDIEVECLPANLPEYIEVDMLEMAIGQVIHISDLTLPEGVESVALQHGEEHDLPVASVNKKKAEEVLDDLEAEDAEAEVAEGDEAASEETPDKDSEDDTDAE